MEWNGQVSESSFHVFVNLTSEPLRLCYTSQKDDMHHGTIEPGQNLFVGTYDFHQWNVYNRSRRLMATYTGPSANITITPTGSSIELNSLRHHHSPMYQQQQAHSHSRSSGSCGSHTPGGGGGAAGDGATAASSAAASSTLGPGLPHDYRMRGDVLGMPIWAFDCVADKAVGRLAEVVGRMMEQCPQQVLERMRSAGAAFAVIGQNQVVSDMPPHRFMRFNADRNLDKTARGLGGTPSVPVTSVGEENVTMEGDRLYPCQSILVHELGHTVLTLGVAHEVVAAVCAAYDAALAAGMYGRDTYMMANEQEYWATAVEAWFESTVRVDVNSGINTRAGLRRHDPRLAALLEATFGDGEWRYHHDAPKPLAMPTWRERRPSRVDCGALGGSFSGDAGSLGKPPAIVAIPPGTSPSSLIPQPDTFPPPSWSMCAGSSGRAGGGGCCGRVLPVPLPPVTGPSCGGLSTCAACLPCCMCWSWTGCCGCGFRSRLKTAHAND